MTSQDMLQKTDHLILLVGTNPLPNYVAAKLLLQKGGQIHLLHSADTRDIAKRLEQLLGVNANRVEIDEADAADIEQKMTDLIAGIKRGLIGLHYTGGTKVMAVHAYRAFLQTMEDIHSDPTPICSYLDARSYELKFDPVGSYGGYAVKSLKLANVSLKTALELHDIKLTEKSLDREISLPVSAQLLAELHTCGQTAQKWRQWCNDEVRAKGRIRNKWIEKQSKLAKITLNLPADDVFQKLNEQLCAELGLPASNAISLAQLKQGNPFRKTYHLLAWLDGVWLENYVFNEISAIAEGVGLNDFAMSLDTSQITGKPNFEFDVGAIKGYQLFGLSCSTTQNKGLAKSKLFEAYIRARQLGGDEARVALVCPQAGLKKKLEKELPESVHGKVRIFDSTSLENLREELQDWFEYPDRLND